MTSWWYAPHLDSKNIEERDERQLVKPELLDELLGLAPEEANLQGSPNGDGTHSIVLDLDCEHEYRRSSTPGHGHLIIPARLMAGHYLYLLRMLEAAGVISKGYLEHAERRDGATFVRAPGVKKPADAAPSDTSPEEVTA